MTATRRLVMAGATVAVVAIAVTAAFFERDRIRGLFSRGSISGMTTPADTASPGPDARASVSLDLRRRQLIGVRTTTVTHGAIVSTLRTVAVVRAAETRLTDVNIKVEGWIRDLPTDYTGQAVARDQVLFTLYSPDLLAAEREYLLALKARDDLRGSPVPDARERSESLVSAARRRLELLDVTPEQIARLEQEREPAPTETFRSPVDGFVLEKIAVVGMHVTPGQTLYRLANLDVVWIEADTYEHDLPVVRTGATARVTLDAYPGSTFTARVIFVNPSLDPATRTAKVRFEVPNPAGRLKPGMYANVEIATPQPTGLIVPVDAVIDSGRQQLVFVDEGDGAFTPRQVKIGERGRDTVEIVSGLKEGDRLATSAAFFLDSESQLRAVGGYEAPPASPSSASETSRWTLTLAVQPDPPKTGDNTFTVAVKDAAGQPVSDADVSILLFMPAMPTMNMPAMRNTVKLSPASPGLYRGAGEIMMAGRWEATVTVSQHGHALGTLQTTVVAR